MKAGGMESRAVVEVEAHGQSEGHHESAKTEAQGGEVLVEVIARLGDKA